MPDCPFNGGHAKIEADGPAARRERILAQAAETVERLERQAFEHERWRVDPQRLAAAEGAQWWIDDLNRRKNA